MPHDQFTDALAAAIRNGEPYPAFPAGLTVDEGESMQPALAERFGGAAGLKVGVGEAPMQQFFGLDGPLLGHLYADRQLAPGSELATDPAVRVECELGLRLDPSGRVTSMCPVIEIVRPDFSVPTDVTGANLAACNVAADRFIAGPDQEPPDHLGDVTLARNGETILEADLASSLGGPTEALRWVRTEADRRSIELWDGMIAITGTCGSAMPLEPGDYTADFGPLGIVTFTAS